MIKPKKLQAGDTVATISLMACSKAGLETASGSLTRQAYGASAWLIEFCRTPERDMIMLLTG
jgi:hypothetical protein